MARTPHEPFAAYGSTLIASLRQDGNGLCLGLQPAVAVCSVVVASAHRGHTFPTAEAQSASPARQPRRWSRSAGGDCCRGIFPARPALDLCRRAASSSGRDDRLVSRPKLFGLAHCPANRPETKYRCRCTPSSAHWMCHKGYAGRCVLTRAYMVERTRLRRRVGAGSFSRRDPVRSTGSHTREIRKGAWGDT